MGSFIERIQYFMDKSGINNNQMTVAAGLSVGLIGRAIKSKSGLNSDSIEKILYAYPNLNPTWLLTGKGNMLINSSSTNCPDKDNKLDDNSFRKDTCVINASNDKTFLKKDTPSSHSFAKNKSGSSSGDSYNTVASLKNEDYQTTEKTYSNINLEICRTSTDLANKLLNNESETSIPFYDLPVSAGSLGILDAENANITVPAGYIKLPVFRGCEAIFPIIGISMEPLVHSGDWIGVKSIDNLSRSWDFIQTGVIYLIITREDRMIKFIEKSDDDDFIICSSPNYHPFKVYKGDIVNIYRVKAIARGV
jgi:hypothetical protein